jgi:hypothetical protein
MKNSEKPIEETIIVMTNQQIVNQLNDCLFGDDDPIINDKGDIVAHALKNE